MTPRALLPLTLLAFALPATGASAATCTGSAKDPNIAEANFEGTFSCDTAINNGTLAITMNRGGKLAGHPEYDGGAGSLSCSVAAGPSGTSTISCKGGLPAGTKVILDVQLGPGPCSSPAFSASVAGSFGDGTTSQPSPVPYSGCSGGGGGGGGGPTDPGPGHDFDPGGVFQGSPQGLPRKATVAQARAGLRFKIKLGVRGKVVVTIEVGKKVVGKFGPHRTHAGPTSLVAKLSAAGARALAGKHTRAKVHIEVMPNADEGFTQHGRKYVALTLTG